MQMTADDQSNHKEVWEVGAASSLQPFSPSDSQQPPETTHEWSGNTLFSITGRCQGLADCSLGLCD